MNPRTVIRALVDLDYEKANVGVTGPDVANYLKTSDAEVAAAIEELEEARIVERRRGFVKPWGAA
jgi:hypothetical protein